MEQPTVLVLRIGSTVTLKVEEVVDLAGFLSTTTYFRMNSTGFQAGGMTITESEPSDTTHAIALDTNQIFRFMDMPAELRHKSLGFLFDGIRDEAGATCRSHYRRSRFIEEEAVVLDMPMDMVQLFVSQSFFADALPIFARRTIIYLDHPAESITHLADQHGVLGSIIRTCLRHTRSLSPIVTMKPPTNSTLTCLPYFMDHVRRLDVRLKETQYWRRNKNAGGMNISPYRPFTSMWHLVVASLKDVDHSSVSGTYLPGLVDCLARHVFPCEAFSNVRDLDTKLNSSGPRCQVHFWVCVACHVTVDDGTTSEEYSLVRRLTRTGRSRRHVCR